MSGKELTMIDQRFCKYIKKFSQLTRWPIAVCEKGGEIVEKKSRNYLEVAWKSPYLCTRFERETPLESDKNRFWKILKKVPKSFGDSEKWLTFAPASNKTGRLKRCEKRFWKNSEKSFEKIWWFQKDDLSLHHFPLWKSLGNFWSFFLKKIWKVRKKVLPLQPLSASKNEAETNAKSSND